MEIINQTYKLGDEDNIVELLHLVFDGWPQFDLQCKPMEHWKWKYIDNPFSTFKIIIAVNNDNDVVGCYHGRDINVKIGEDIILFNNGADVAVHPDYRRLGIYRKMNESITELRWSANSRIQFWTTGNPILAKSTSARSPDRLDFPQGVSHFVRIRDIGLHFKMAPSENVWIKNAGYRILSTINNIRNVLTFRQPASKKKVKIRSVQFFDARVDIFWNEIASDYSFIVERCQDYLNWRYCDSRGGNFNVFIAEEEGDLIGYCIIRINRKNEEYSLGYIVDLLTLHERYDVSDALIQEAIDFFDSNNINIIDCLAVRNSQLGDNLRKNGFVDSRIKLFLKVSLRDMNEDEIEKYSSKMTMKKMHFVYGDFDAM